MYTRYSKPNPRNQQRRSNTSYRRSSKEKMPIDNGMQNFQSALTQLNQINQMMMESKKSNPMDMFQQFFSNPPK